MKKKSPLCDLVNIISVIRLVSWTDQTRIQRRQVSTKSAMSTGRLRVLRLCTSIRPSSPSIPGSSSSHPRLMCPSDLLIIARNTQNIAAWLIKMTLNWIIKTRLGRVASVLVLNISDRRNENLGLS